MSGDVSYRGSYFKRRPQSCDSEARWGGKEEEVGGRARLYTPGRGARAPGGGEVKRD